MQIVRAGVDSLYFAVNGMLPGHVIEELVRAKAQAIEERRETPIEFGKAKVAGTGISARTTRWI